MHPKCILAVVSGIETDRPVLEAALAVARLFRSRVEVLYPAFDVRAAAPIMWDGMSAILAGEVVPAIERDAEARERRARLDFDQWRSEHGLAADADLVTCWRKRTGQPEAIVAESGRLADLIVVGRPGEDDISTEKMLHAALFDSGRPVLCVPPIARLGIASRIAILWNGSAQAARAIGDAMPVLHAAESVTVLVAAEGGAVAPDAEDLASYLGWHRVNATVRSLETGNAPLAETLLTAAEANGARLVVMGAYGHSRFRETILGGVTRHALWHARLPLWLAH